MHVRMDGCTSAGGHEVGACTSLSSRTCAALQHARMNRGSSVRRRGPRPPVHAVISAARSPPPHHHPKVREASAVASFGASSSGLLLRLTLQLACGCWRLQR